MTIVTIVGAIILIILVWYYARKVESESDDQFTETEKKTMKKKREIKKKEMKEKES